MSTTVALMTLNISQHATNTPVAVSVFIILCLLGVIAISMVQVYMAFGQPLVKRWTAAQNERKERISREKFLDYLESKRK